MNLPTSVAERIKLVQLRIVRRLAETNGLLTASERNDLDELEKKLVILLEGGYVVSPKRGLNFS
jgi:hypothetical protein